MIFTHSMKTSTDIDLLESVQYLSIPIVYLDNYLDCIVLKYLFRLFYVQGHHHVADLDLGHHPDEDEVDQDQGITFLNSFILEGLVYR